MTLVLLAEHDRAIRTHGQEAFPQECCGLLLGRPDGVGRTVVRLVAEENAREPAQRHNRFSISPEAYMRGDREARREGLDIVGFYHSHPGAPARPSAYDLDHAWPWYSYIIVSIRDGRALELTSWVLKDDRSRFEQQELRIVGAEDPPTT